MSADFTILGPSARVVINDQNFAVVTGRYRRVADVPDTTDTESSGYKRNKGGLRQLEAEFEAHQATDVINPHIAPLLIVEGDLIDLQIYPDKDETFNISCGTFRVESIEGNFRVAGSEPQSLRISGKSDGLFTEVA